MVVKYNGEECSLKHAVVNLLTSALIKAWMLMVMYDVLKDIYIANQHLAIVLTIVCIAGIKDFELTVDVK